MRSTPLRGGLVAIASLLTASAASAQHEHSPYAGTETAEGTVLTAEEVAALREAQGMRLALPAELNGYPGPLHVLELAERIGLDGVRVAEIGRIRVAMREAAAAKGEEIIAAERALASGFQSEAVDDASVRRLTRELGVLRGELRAIHLIAHLETRMRLTNEEVARYDHLRGYDR